MSLLRVGAVLFCLAATARAGALVEKGDRLLFHQPEKQPAEAPSQALIASGRLILLGDGWTPQLRHALDAALSRLPPRARSFPGGPLELSLESGRTPLGMGDASHPEWSGERRTFHLYGYSEPSSGPGAERAMFRLERLSPAQREELWRERAIVHAVLERWNDALRWSRRDEWKRITGWLDRFERFMTFREEPLNRYPWAYSRAGGMSSSAEDLLTFAEEALVPPQDFVADAVAPDDRLECQEFSKLRFLEERLTGLGAAPFPRPPCPAFEKWAAPDAVDHFEVIFSAPSGQKPETLFGHVLLRPVYAPTALARGPDFEPVLEIAAITDLNDDLPAHLLHGLSGAYQTIFAVTTMGHQLKQNVEVEQRTLRRFRLNLTPREQRRLVERMWELERRGYLGYYFFTENCAAELLWMINSVLDEGQAERPGIFWVMPSATLDSLAKVRVRGKDGRRIPLLEHLPGDLPSHQTLAADGERKRRRLIARIEQQLPAALSAGWDAIGVALDDARPETRHAAYDDLASLIPATLQQRSDPVIRGLLFDVLKATEAVERYASDRATAAAKVLEAGRALIPKGTRLPTAEELVLERQREFQREDREARAQIDLDRVLRLQSLLEGFPKRPYTASEQRRAAEIEAARAAFLRWTQVEGDLIERHFADIAVSATAALQRQEAAQAVTEDARAIRGSGFGFLSYAMAAGTDGAGKLYPLAQLRSALVRERLGEVRTRGFSPSAEVRLLDVEVDLRLSSGIPLERVDGSLIRFRSLGREPQVLRRSLTDLLGFGAGLDFVREQVPSIDQRGRAWASSYLVLDSTPRFERYLAIGVGAAADIPFIWYPQGLLLGPTAELLLRYPLPGPSQNAVRLEALYTPQWTLLGGALGARTDEVRAVAEAEVVIGDLDFREMSLGPRVELLDRTGPLGRERRFTVGLQWSWL